MTFLSIVERELRVVVRRPAIYGALLFSAAGFVPVSLLLDLFALFQW